MSSMTTPLYRRINWQEQLRDYCRKTRLPEPVFELVSDRRGGRTAWSSSVKIGQNAKFCARFFYDGDYLDNAKEDAAEVALMQLSSQYHQPTAYPGQLFPYQPKLP